MTDAKSRLKSLVRSSPTGPRKPLQNQIANLQAVLGKSEKSIPRDAHSAEMKTNLSVYVLADRTASMFYTIERVRDSLDKIADELFSQGKNIGIAVWGLEDHYGARKLGVNKAPLVNDVYGLAQQLKTLNPAPPNEDEVENYECGWLEVAKEISSRPKNGKIAIITFMETASHGQQVASAYDHGCPFGVDWRQALDSAKALSDYWFVVDCDGYSGNLPHFKSAKRQCVNAEAPNEYLIELGKAEEIIPDLLCAMVEKARGPASYQQLMKRLERKNPNSFREIAGYLGSGK